MTCQKCLDGMCCVRWCVVVMQRPGTRHPFVASCEKQKVSDVSKLVGKTVGLQFGLVERTHNEQCHAYQRRQRVSIIFDHTLYNRPQCCVTLMYNRAQG
jgi:hypothetical protein